MSNNLIQNTITYVKEKLSDAEGGHDWFHIERVYKLSIRIGEEELKRAPVDIMVVKLGALLHDIADSKFHEGNDEVGPRTAREYLQSQSVGEGVISHVENIVRHISFKGGKHTQTFSSLELSIVQDADRLDAIGAIGIARTFNYGGFKGRVLYDPDIKPNLQMTKQEYQKSTAPTLNHFYEKLLLLKDRMNTQTGRLMAEKRHAYMESFLDEFYAEWNGLQ
jgi:uncharacterized protein